MALDEVKIGGLGAIAPSRRGDFSRIAPRALMAGLLACWCTATLGGFVSGQ